MAMDKLELQIYNTLTKQTEVFKSKEPGKVKMYICGVTPYDFSHIGHARSYVAFDILYRYLKYLRYDVVYVRNFSDVDEKIIRRANEFGEDPIALSGRYCQEFLKDMDDLQCLPPIHQPRVSEHMEEIKEMIAKVMTNGYAYTVDGDVYFSVDSFPEYGRISGQKLEDNRAGVRFAVDSRKLNPADFALWKVTRLYHPIALRYFLLGTHYRSPVNYSISQIEIASESVYYIYQTLHDSEEALSAFQQGTVTETKVKGVRVSPQAQECISELRNELETKLSDDLHTPAILNAALQEALRLMNSYVNMLKKKQQQLSVILYLSELQKEVKAVLDVLGLLLGSTCAEVLQQFKERALKRADLTEEDILLAIEERALARKNKEFARSDQIRTDLVAKGIALMDIGT